MNFCIPKLCFEYMVVYSFPNGTGRVSITTPKRIKSYHQIEEIDQTIREMNNFPKAFVVHYKFIRMFIKWKEDK